MPRAGRSYVWITCSLGMPIGFIVHFLWWVSLAFAISGPTHLTHFFRRTVQRLSGWCYVLRYTLGHILSGAVAILVNLLASLR